MEDIIATPARVRELLDKYGLSAKKGYGQNFLVDANILRGIVEAADISKDDFCIEIGPGLGSLTQFLSEAAGSVLAVEIDRGMVKVLEETLAGCDNVTILNSDILKTDLAPYMEAASGKVKLCANLPYYITTPVIMQLLESRLPFESMTVMIQKEVAQRMSALPGSAEYGALSVACSYYAESELNFIVSPNCFMPRPKVESAVVTLKLRKTPPVEVANEEVLFKIIKCAFGQRRKTLVNGLFNLGDFGLSKDELANMLISLGFDDKVRGEKLSLEDFAKIAGALCTRV